MSSQSPIEARAPVLILGGTANALSLMRSFGRAGITVRACMEPHAALLSRYCSQAFPVPVGQKPEAFFEQLLCSDRYPYLKGSVVLACGDDALEFIARNRASLEENYLLERNDADLTLQLLNKQRTLKIAKRAGLPTPEFWEIKEPVDIDDCRESLNYPVILKPFFSHLFQRIYGSKFAVAETAEELLSTGNELLERGIQFMVSEKVPGPDNLNCSYYTYRDEEGRELFQFTKRCIRRYPINQGGGTYQITENLPDVEELGKRFFEAIDYRGIGNLEFKRDERTGTLKVIECNTRFTAVQELLLQSGVDSALVTYAHLTGQPIVESTGCAQHVAIWSPFKDLRAFRQEREIFGVTWRDWRKSMTHKKLVFPYLSLSDPRPFLALAWDDVKYLLAAAFKRIVPGRGKTYDG